MTAPGQKLRHKAEHTADRLPDLMIRAERAARNIFHGEHAQRKSGAGEKFWQFREYTPQDRPQDIDWRQSGKTDRIFIRQKERQQPQTVLFWCADGQSMHFSSSPRHLSKSESAHILTLALAILFTRTGERVGMLSSAQTGRSEAALENIGNALITPQARESLPSAGQSRQNKNSALILAGDFLDPAELVESSFQTLDSNAALVIQTLDPAEIELPWNGRAIFEDAGKKYHETVQNISSIRDAYRERIQYHINSVKKICAERGWDYILHRTDNAPEKTLEEIYLGSALVKPRGTR